MNTVPMFTNTVKADASKDLSNSVAAFYANGGVKTVVVRRKRAKISQRTGPAYCGGASRKSVGQNDVARKGAVALS
jgi:hypothetical protein